jgi:pimeloyl-ACP methyl ester carboxylesterase
VLSLILVAPGLSGYPPSVEQSQRISEIIVIGAQEGADKAAEKWLADPYIAPAMENPASSERVREIVMDNAESFVRPYLQQLPANPAATRLSEIKVPTLIVVGDRDIKDIYAIVDILDSDVVNSRKEVIHGSGHLVNMENRDEFNRIVLDFLRSLDP